jgi:hypothetical protein
VLDRAERVDLGAADGGAAERERLRRGVDPHEHSGVLEAPREVAAVLPSGSPRSCRRSGSGAVAITARGWLSASRRTSTALRRATSSSRSASPRTGSRQGEPVAGERGRRGSGGIQSVVFAAQPPLGSRRAADLEHQLAASSEIAAQPGAVAAAALNRPGTPARCVPVSDAKERAIAARVGR